MYFAVVLHNNIKCYFNYDIQKFREAYQRKPAFFPIVTIMGPRLSGIC